MLELLGSELASWLASPSDVDRLRGSIPLLIVHDDRSAAGCVGAISGLVTVAIPGETSEADWGKGADLNAGSLDQLNIHTLLDQLDVAVGTNPQAAVALVELLRLTESLDPAAGLITESTTYSMLQRGTEHQRWLDSRRRLAASPHLAPDDSQHQLGASVVSLERSEDQLTIILDRPDRHNAYSATMRDQLVAALTLVEADRSIAQVRLRGAGPSFCSGGDLDEFGTSPDPATAHRIRLDRSAAALLWRLRDRVAVDVHGACIGAGVELAAVAANVIASETTWFALPEVSMGLVPGAGGTVSITKRLGRHRTAWMALTGTSLDVETAQRWGLVDAVTCAAPSRSAEAEPDRPTSLT